MLVERVAGIRQSCQLSNDVLSQFMMTSSNGNIFRVTDLLCREFPAQRPVKRSFNVFFDLRLNKRLNQQLRWRHQMETFHALLALNAGNSTVNGEFPAQSPVTRNFDVFFDLRLE